MSDDPFSEYRHPEIPEYMYKYKPGTTTVKGDYIERRRLTPSNSMDFSSEMNGTQVIGRTHVRTISNEEDQINMDQVPVTYGSASRRLSARQLKRNI